MNDPQVLRAEQEYTQRVQQLLLSVIEQSTSISASHAEAVHMIVADAWDELRKMCIRDRAFSGSSAR